MDDEGNKQDLDKDKGNIPNQIDEDVVGIPKCQAEVILRQKRSG